MTSMPSLRRRDAIMAMTTALGLGGCIPGLPGAGPEPRTFRVTPKYAFADDLPAVTWALVVAEPSAERTLDTNRIAVVTGGINVDYVALAFWIDRAPSMLQTLMVQSFRNSGQIAQVGTTRDRLRPEFLLTSDLRAFQLNRGAEPDLVRVRLDVQLLRMPQRDPSAARAWSPTGRPRAAGSTRWCRHSTRRPARSSSSWSRGRCAPGSESVR